MNIFLPNGVTDSFADEVDLHRADAVSLLARFTSFFTGRAPLSFSRTARNEPPAGRANGSDLDNVPARAVGTAQLSGPKPPDTMQLPPTSSADILLFARLPNGMPIRGTGRLRKLRRSAVTRDF